MFNSEHYLVYRLIWEKAVELGGVNGFAHAWSGEADGPSPQAGLAVVLPHDLMHFIEVLQFNRGNYESWYDVLNLGFRVAPLAGSDYPSAEQSIPGHERLYTRVAGDLTYTRWLGFYPVSLIGGYKDTTGATSVLQSGPTCYPPRK